MHHSPTIHTVAMFVVLAIATFSLAQRPDRAQRAPDTLKVGDTAPDFALPAMDGEDTVTLSNFQGDRPVALIFGSYT